jgi:hypothetical protein
LCDLGEHGGGSFRPIKLTFTIGRGKKEDEKGKKDREKRIGAFIPLCDCSWFL